VLREITGVTQDAAGQTRRWFHDDYFDLFVQQASEARYERIYLTVRVPPALGKPITRDDVESSLWEGGSIALRVRCADDGGYVAEGVEASPPS